MFKNGYHGFAAPLVTRTLDMDWLAADGIVGEGRTFAGLVFCVDGERVTADIEIDVEVEGGLIERRRADWHDAEKVKADALGELLKAQALARLTDPLKDAREAAGLSQRAVGELLGYEGGAAQQVIHRWEAGTREPGAVSLARWAEALGMSLKVAPNT